MIRFCLWVILLLRGRPSRQVRCTFEPRTTHDCGVLNRPLPANRDCAEHSSEIPSMRTMRPLLWCGLAAIVILSVPALLLADAPALPLLRSMRSCPWSASATWEKGRVPATGDRVQIRAGHRVVYDVRSERVLRSLHVAGTLTFAADRDTRLDVGLLKIQPGDDARENGFDCDAHMSPPRHGQPLPALEVGTPNYPIAAKHTALIRLTYVA